MMSTLTDNPQKRYMKSRPERDNNVILLLVKRFFSPQYIHL